MKTINDFIIGEEVLCNGQTDYIIDFINPNDEENYKMGYRIVLKENGLLVESTKKSNDN